MVKVKGNKAKPAAQELADLAEETLIGLPAAAALCWMTEPALRMALSRRGWPARYVLVDGRRQRALVPSEVRQLRQARLR